MVAGVRPMTMDMFESFVDMRRTTLYFLPGQPSSANKIHKRDGLREGLSLASEFKSSISGFEMVS